MANIVLIATDTSITDITNISDVFTNGGHTVTSIDQPNISTVDLETFDLIVCTDMPNNASTVSDIVAAFNNGIPVMSGTINSSSTTTQDFGVAIGVHSNLARLSSSSRFVIIPDVTGNEFWQGGEYDSPIRAWGNRGEAYGAGMPFAEEIKVTTFDQANGNSSVSSVVNYLLERGSENLLGNPTPARYVYNGYLDGAPGIFPDLDAAILRMVDWLTTDVSSYNISGTVTLDEQPHESKVIVTTTEEVPRVVGTGMSDVDGNYTINVGDYDGTVMVHTIQDYGVDWQSGMSVVAGDIIHPVTPTGFIFRVTVAGDTGASEPAWPLVAGETVTDNNVTYESEILLQPEIQGYVQTTEVL